MSDLESVRKAHRTVDRYLVLAQEQGARKGIVPSCRRGCFACCYEPVYAERREAALALEAAEALPEEERAEIRERIRTWMDAIKASAILQAETPHVADYRKLRLPCPFLKDGECRIYADRPMGCRTHFAVGPREACEDDGRRLGQQFMYVPDILTGPMFEILDGPGSLVMDHFGLFLGEILLGEKVESASRSMLVVRGDQQEIFTRGKG